MHTFSSLLSFLFIIFAQSLDNYGEKYFNMDINIDEILIGMPGITPVEGADLQENSIVMMHRSGHKSPTLMKLEGIQNEGVLLHWNDTFNEQMDRTYADHQENTERAAVCLSVVLAKHLTGHTVLMRSRKGTGFDYMLGDEEDIFLPKARLEISGIERETPNNTMQGRFNQKSEQVKPTDSTGLPAYISIIEFSNPKALFDRKEII